MVIEIDASKRCHYGAGIPGCMSGVFGYWLSSDSHYFSSPCMSGVWRKRIPK